MRNLFRSKPFKVVLFEPEHSEDESADFDKSETDSADGGSSTSQEHTAVLETGGGWDSLCH